ncbi:MAG TPA: hypothetical protein VGG32_05860 [Thermoplasmata archaeon]
MVLAPFLAELVSGSTPPQAWVLPQVFLVFMALYLLYRRRTAKALPGTSHDADPPFHSGRYRTGSAGAYSARSTM